MSRSENNETIQGIKLEDIEAFKEAAEALSNVLKKIQDYQPMANAYLSMDSLNLMSCDFHLPSVENPQDHVVASVYMPGFDGGDW